MAGKESVQKLLKGLDVPEVKANDVQAWAAAQIALHDQYVAALKRGGYIIGGVIRSESERAAMLKQVDDIQASLKAIQKRLTAIEAQSKRRRW